MIEFERISQNNPWWQNPENIRQDSLILEFERQKFQYWHPFYKNFPLNKDVVLTLRGPRRVGKSTLFHLIIKKLLLEEKVPPETVFFLTADRISGYNELFEIVTSYLDFAHPRTNHRLFLFIDEISFVTDWQRAIKELVDTGRFKNATVVLIGSSLLDLKFGTEFLAGRRGNTDQPDIFYYPLSFADFVRFVNPEINTQLQKHFSDYLLTGGFPQTINALLTTGSIANSYYETFLTWVENDLHKTKRDSETSYRILDNIFLTLTTQMSFTSLAKDSGLKSQFVIQQYLDIMDKMFLLFPLHTFILDQKKQDMMKNKKIYFTDPFIFNALYLKSRQMTEDYFTQSKKLLAGFDFFPNIVENTVGAYLKRNNHHLYWGKTAKGEIDFVAKEGEILKLFEVKYREKIEYQNYLSYAKNLVFISKKDFSKKPVPTLPLEIFLLQ